MNLLILEFSENFLPVVVVLGDDIRGYYVVTDEVKLVDKHLDCKVENTFKIIKFKLIHKYVHSFLKLPKFSNCF